VVGERIAEMQGVSILARIIYEAGRVASGASFSAQYLSFCSDWDAGKSKDSLGS